jgi:hypothetical protein
MANTITAASPTRSAVVPDAPIEGINCLAIAAPH